MTVAVIIGVISLICLTAMGVCVTVTSRRSVSDAFRALERHDVRNEKQMQTVLDRLMTIHWEDFAAIQATQEGDEGVFLAPSEQGDEGRENAAEELRQIFTLRGISEPTDDELALLAEDFPSEMGVDS